MHEESEQTLSNKHIKKCSTPLVIRKMQIKITMRHYFTPGRMAIIKRQTAKPPLVKMWENWILSLLVGMYNGLATSERSLAVP